jgi:NAD-reducing hydrogenase small subunit
LLERVLPLHELIPVDHFLPGCPPSAERIQTFLEALLHGEAAPMEGPAMLGFG